MGPPDYELLALNTEMNKLLSFPPRQGLTMKPLFTHYIALADLTLMEIPPTSAFQLLG